MGKSLQILSVINSLCCVLLIIYQIQPFLEATDYVSIYRRKQYVVETGKLIAYIIGLLAYLSLGFYKSCFNSIRNNFALKFCGLSIILSVVIMYDGVTRELYHYIAYSIINFFCMILIYKEILKEWEEEMRHDEYVDAGDGTYEKIKVREDHHVVDIHEAKRKEAEGV